MARNHALYYVNAQAMAAKMTIEGGKTIKVESKETKVIELVDDDKDATKEATMEDVD